MAPKSDILYSAALQCASSPFLLELFSTSHLPIPHLKLISVLQDLMAESGSLEPRKDAFSDFVGAVADIQRSAKNPVLKAHHLLIDAYKGYQTATIDARYKKRRLAADLGLDWSVGDRARFLETISTGQLEELETPYPPASHWWYETSAAKDRWHWSLTQGKQPDSRKPRHQLIHVEPKALQRCIKADESAIIRDSKTGKIVLVVLCNFCSNLGVLKWVDTSVTKILEYKKSVRLEDPGKIALVGYSAGSLSSPAFHWTKNLLSKKLPPELVSDIDLKTTSVCALFWNLIQSRFPDEILEDFHNFLDQEEIVRMGNNPNSPIIARDGEYTIEAPDGTQVAFQGVQLAPPTGVFAINYSRAGHYEHAPHKYAIAWTTGRTGGVEKGGHFYLANYGIMVESSANTVVAWPPTCIHGTSLQDRLLDGHDPSFQQTGLAFVTSNRIPQVWRRYRENLISHTEVEDLLENECGY